MDTFRKWLNKPKADDKSLLARFYHADRSLTAISSELDSFDGRAEPDRCSRLVSRLRQGQDKVLSITNQIMEELLGDDRAPRAFRAKFPEEVLQENLAGQLWFGAECLAAGSSIMNREQESKDMRPLAQAVTKSLANVRNLLRDQCLRNNVPNSQTLHLDFNDSNTEQLYESLKIFDRLFAEFELRYVSAMVQVKTKHEYEMQEFICVLFSETLQRALTVGLLEQDKVDAFDPGLMFSIPRLAIVTGLVIYNRGPLNMDMPAEQLSEMFRPYRSFLIKIRDLLRKLNKNELYQLEKLLCTNEDIHLKQLNVVSNGNGSDNDSKNTTNNNNCDDAATTSSTSSSSAKNENKNGSDEGERETEAVPAGGENGDADTAAVNNNNTKVFTENGVFTNNDIFTMSFSSDVSTPSVSPSPSPQPSTSSTTSSAEWTDDENVGTPKESDIVSADCATGYLIPNTNLGNLLQSNEVPLTDNFIASEDDEFGSCNGGEDGDLPEVDQELNGNIAGCSRVIATTVADSSEESEQLTIKGTEGKSIDSRDSQYAKLEKSSSSSSTGDSSGRRLHRHHHHHHHSHRHHHHHHHHHHSNNNRSSVGGTSSSASSSSSSNSSSRVSSSSSISDSSRHHSKKRSKNSTQKRDTSSGDTTSSLSDDPHDHTKFISTEYLLHRLFVSIASVADQLQTNFASDLRQILRSVFLMNMSPAQDEIEIPKKNTKDTTAELFEFRASENDVIQQQSAGSNQSIYSAEEVNPELDNVFNNTNSNMNGTDRPPAIQRGHTVDLVTTENTPSVPARNNIGRSRSLGEETQAEVSPNTSERRHGTLSSYLRERRLSSGSRSPANSSSSTASNSPVSERSAAHFTAVANNNLNNNTNHSNNSILNTATTNNNNNNNNSMDVPTPQERESTSPSPQIRMSPPVWVPDDKAPRCMSCTTPFTAFRRRHHCRNCGGVFCGVCSSASTPLPKFGLTKAVRVCRDCFVHQLTA